MEDHYLDEENGKSKRNKLFVLLLLCFPRKICLPSHPVPSAKEAELPAASFSAVVNVTAISWPGPQLLSTAGCQPTEHKGPTPSLASFASPRNVWLNGKPWSKSSTNNRGRRPGIIKWVKIIPGLAFGSAVLGVLASNFSSHLRKLWNPVPNRIFWGNSLPDKTQLKS